jgi:hypothetical protein
MDLTTWINLFRAAMQREEGQTMGTRPDRSTRAS